MTRSYVFYPKESDKLPEVTPIPVETIPTSPVLKQQTSFFPFPIIGTLLTFLLQLLQARILFWRQLLLQFRVPAQGSMLLVKETETGWIIIEKPLASNVSSVESVKGV